MKSSYVFNASDPSILPDLILGSLELHNIYPKDVKAAVFVDRNLQNHLSESYLLFTAEKLVLISGVTSIYNDRKNSLRKGTDFKVYAETDYREWPLSDFEYIKSDNLVSSCRIVISGKTASYTAAYSSLYFREDLRYFCRYLNDFKKNGVFIPASPEDAPVRELYCPKCGLRYADPENKNCPRCADKSRVLLRTFKIFWHYKWKMLLVVLTLALIVVTSVLTPYISVGFFYDQVLDEMGAYYGRIALVITLIVLTRLLSQVFATLHRFPTSNLAADMIYDLKKLIFSSINRLSVSFFTSRKTGGLMTQVNSDAQTIYWFFCDYLPNMCVSIVQVLVAGVLMFLISPPLAVAALIMIPVSVVAIKFIFKKMNLLHARRYGRSRSMNSALSDMLGGVRVVKAFSREESEKKRFSKKSNDLANADLTTSLYSAKAFPSVNILLSLGNIFVWALGGILILTRAVNPSLIGEGTVLKYGILATFLSYVSMIYGPLFSFVGMVSTAADSMNAMGRLIEIMDAKPDVFEKEHPVRIKEMNGNITFKDVGFSYIPGKPILENISFEVKEGETFGIVGRTGAGKSTLVNLLIRLYDPSEGAIYVDGVNLKDVAFEDLRNNIAIVSQDTYLFAGSILDNIRYARPEATLEEALEAAIASGAHEFIMKLPDGYDTLIGQGHKGLSGGERQRLSIARAILKNPKILILDEATAAMDTRTEQIIQRSLFELSKGRTTLMIAHRLSTLRDADRLLVIDDGKLAEIGTHDELIEKQGIYYRLYTLQLEAMKNIGITE